MNETQFEFLDNLANRTIFLKARQFGDDIWELEGAGLVSLKWDGQFFVAKPTLAGRERIERELAKREADKIARERDVELKASLERERDEAKRTANRERNERRCWQCATILAMLFSAIISGRTLSCSCMFPSCFEESNEHHGSQLNENRIVASPGQESLERIAGNFDFDVPATNPAHPLPMQPSAKPKSGSDKMRMTMDLMENGTNRNDNLKESTNSIVTNSLAKSCEDSQQQERRSSND